MAVFVYKAPHGASLGELRDPPLTTAEPPWLRRGETDEDGAFTIDDVPSGRVAIEVVVPVYRRTRWIVDTTSAPSRGLRLYLRKEEDSLYRTTVVSTRTSSGPGCGGSGLALTIVLTLEVAERIRQVEQRVVSVVMLILSRPKRQPSAPRESARQPRRCG